MASCTMKMQVLKKKNFSRSGHWLESKGANNGISQLKDQIGTQYFVWVTQIHLVHIVLITHLLGESIIEKRLYIKFLELMIF